MLIVTSVAPAGLTAFTDKSCGEQKLTNEQFSRKKKHANNFREKSWRSRFQPSFTFCSDRETLKEFLFILRSWSATRFDDDETETGLFVPIFFASHLYRIRWHFRLELFLLLVSVFQMFWEEENLPFTFLPLFLLPKLIFCSLLCFCCSLWHFYWDIRTQQGCCCCCCWRSSQNNTTFVSFSFLSPILTFFFYRSWILDPPGETKAVPVYLAARCFIFLNLNQN